MTVQLHDTGEEYILDVVFDGSVTRVTTVDIGVYSDSTDALADSDDVGAITTEPTGASYTRQTVSLNTTEVNNTDSGGDWQSELNTVTFDTSDSSQTVDSYFVVVNFQADDTSDTSANDHLLFTGSLDQSYDLSSVDSLQVNDNEMGLSVT